MPHDDEGYSKEERACLAQEIYERVGGEVPVRWSG